MILPHLHTRSSTFCVIIEDLHTSDQVSDLQALRKRIERMLAVTTQKDDEIRQLQQKVAQVESEKVSTHIANGWGWDKEVG